MVRLCHRPNQLVMVTVLRYTCLAASISLRERGCGVNLTCVSRASFLGGTRANDGRGCEQKESERDQQVWRGSATARNRVIVEERRPAPRPVADA